MENIDVEATLKDFLAVETYAKDQEKLAHKLLHTVNAEKQILDQKIEGWKAIPNSNQAAVQQLTDVMNRILDYVKLHMQMLIEEENAIDQLEKSHTVTSDNIVQLKLAEEHDAHLLHDTSISVNKLEETLNSLLNTVSENISEEGKQTAEYKSLQSHTNKFKNFSHHMDALIKKSFAFWRRKDNAIKNTNPDEQRGDA